jgi:hypothetical protein
VIWFTYFRRVTPVMVFCLSRDLTHSSMTAANVKGAAPPVPIRPRNAAQNSGLCGSFGSLTRLPAFAVPRPG